MFPETGTASLAVAPAATVQADREFFVGMRITADELIGVVCDLCAESLVVS
jgi:hypothetical protein